MPSGHVRDIRFSSERVPLDVNLVNGVTCYRLASLIDAGVVADRARLERLPMTIKVLLENLLRNAGNGVVRDAEIESMAHWNPATFEEGEFPFYPPRVLLQAFPAVPAPLALPPIPP